ncbi:DEAD/DEAH box helicase [Loigolactobacillus jiayinensis]|uniref:DEAD-box ATP-dependent RNA helicase CshA n=1 Tax=Loigolactobacillus jiayinensis TaxID=2486016 RepID=A0ABW1RJ26_9LACO|nr:DEAD/DEAH box helicase [Loigolactobacillus jiayinensis]
MKFTDLGLDPELLKAVQRQGFEEATPIQAETIPLALSGVDVIGQAQTGTGKTAAFGLAILQRIDLENPNVQALIISPTRELAVQTQEELYRLGQDKHAKVQAVYGGADIGRQIRSLKEHPQIIVGTPGRLQDHINRRTIRLDHVQTLVLDEADEMLDMGFLEDIEKIVQQVPETRQTLLFSATIPTAIRKIADRFMHDPKMVQIKAKELTADLLDQYFVQTKEFEKFDVMTRLFDVQKPELTIVFGRTKRRVDELSKGLRARGYNAEGIHGDLSQQKRMSVLRSFKGGHLDILVATDVAARGLDITGVTHVYNYDVPQDPDSYVHRVGRTARAGHKGTSVTFVTPNEMGYLRTIEKLTRLKMQPLKAPTAKEALQGQLTSAVAAIHSMIDDKDLSNYEAQGEQLLDNYTPLQLAAALLKVTSKDDAAEVPVKITPERPLPRRGHGGNGRRSGGYRGGHRSNDRDRRGGGNGGGHSNNHSAGGHSRSRDNNHGSSEGRYDRKKRYDKKDGGSKRNYTIHTHA